MLAETTSSVSNRSQLLFVLAAAFALFFVGWTWLALDSGGRLDTFDRAIADYWRQGGGEARASNLFLTELGGVATNLMVAVMGAVWQLSHGRRRFAAAWVAIVLGNGIGNQLLKVFLDRDRPPEPDRVVVERNKSYPSGHAMGSAVGYGMVCYALLRQARFPFRRTSIVVFFLALIVGVGFSRVYLRAHWFSDVIGGWAAGLCWLSFCLALVERRRHLSTKPHAAPPRPPSGKATPPSNLAVDSSQ